MLAARRNLDDDLLVESEPAARAKRFERVIFTSVWGEPLDPRVWSGAPARLGAALGRLGVSVEGFHSSSGPVQRATHMARHVAGGFGPLVSSEQILRGEPARQHRAREVARIVARTGIRDVLHFGTFDLPSFDILDGVRHYLYCDQTWDQSLDYRRDGNCYTQRAHEEYERLERESLQNLAHVFTFSALTRDNIIAHYGVPADRVTAIGSGMGMIEPHFGPKTYDEEMLLFVAKHLFKTKGGVLLLEAFFLLLEERPNLKLTVVGDEASRILLPRHPAINFQSNLSWKRLQKLYRDATLLVQPMFNDPWGQIYLESLISRTPVLGLNRNGLCEITEAGRHGFLVDSTEPQALAEVVSDALDDKARLAAMGFSGQRHVLSSYSWDIAAERIAFP